MRFIFLHADESELSSREGEGSVCHFCRNIERMKTQKKQLATKAKKTRQLEGKTEGGESQG